MRRHAKASSAGSTSSRANALGSIRRAFATRGASSDVDGSGAPSRGLSRMRGLALVAALVLVLVFAFAPAAQAEKQIVNAFAGSGVGAGQFSLQMNQGANTPVSAPSVSPGGIAVNSGGAGSGAEAGDVYVVDSGSHRIQQFSSTGEFIRAWGYDVARSGPGNTGANEQQTVTVPGTVTAGTFTLTLTTVAGEATLKTKDVVSDTAESLVGDITTSFGSFRVGDAFAGVGSNTVPVTKLLGPDALMTQTFCGPNSVCQLPPGWRRIRVSATETTGPIAYNATAAEVQAAIEALPAVEPGDVTVSGGPGTVAPFTLTFGGGEFAHGDVPQATATSSLTGGSAAVATTVGGGGFEICQGSTDACRSGVASSVNGGMSSPQGIAVEQGTGNVYVTDPGNRRIDVFGSDGTFQGAFGWGVATGASALQFCAAGCLAGSAGGGAGQFGAAIGGAAIAPAGAPNAGNLLVADTTNNRVDEFQPVVTGGVVTGASFVRGIGWDTITGAPTTLESCTTVSTCKAGTSGGGAGQFSSLLGVAEDATGAIYTVNATRTVGSSAAASCSASSRCAVQKFNPTATTAADFAPAELTATTGAAVKIAATAVGVDPVSGDVYVAKGFEDTSKPGPEYRILRFDSSGNLLETALQGAAVGWLGTQLGHLFAGPATTTRHLAPIFDIAYDPGTGHALFATTEQERAHVYALDEAPAEAKATLDAGLDSPAATGITKEGATVSGVVTPAHGIDGHTFYEFEYTNGTTWAKGPRTDAGNGSAPVPTSLDLELETGQEYEVRLHAFIPSNPDLSVYSPISKFKTLGEPPTAETGGSWWSSPTATAPTLLVKGFLNPRNEATSFYFQYVSEAEFLASGYANAVEAPFAPGQPAAKSFSTVEVQETLYDLDPGQAYHYRLVAVNPTGTTFGDDRTVQPPEDGTRFYELVTTGNSGGLASGSAMLIADQDARVLFTGVPIDDPPSSPGAYNPKFAQRTDTGWKVIAPALDPADQYVGLGSVSDMLSAADLSRGIFPQPSILLGAGREPNNTVVQWKFANGDGTWGPASPRLETLAAESTTPPPTLFIGITGAAADFSRYVVTGMAGRAFLPGEPLIPGSNLYLVDSANLTASLLNVDSAGTQLGGVCGAELGSSRKAGAFSLDGSVTYFSARPGAPLSGTCSDQLKADFPARIYRRVGNTTTEVSASQCARPAVPAPPGPCQQIAGDDVFQSASGDGSVMFFSSPRQLADSDVDSGQDLYVYDADPPAGQPGLAQVSAGGVTAGHPTIGSGAEFVGVVDKSFDGSRVYFVAKGQLTPDAIQGENNLFVYQRDDDHPTGRLALVATLTNQAGDTGLWGLGNGTGNGRTEVYALPTGKIDSGGGLHYGDGRFLVFNSVANLVPADTDSAKDLYRYSDLTGDVVCVSCAANGASNVEILPRQAVNSSAPAVIQQSRIADEGVSRIVFSSDEALLPEDQNGVTDAYLWDEGQLTLISVDAGKFGTSSIKDAFTAVVTAPTISLDGRDVYFNTAARLVSSSEDSDNAFDMYDARIDGGFPSPKPQAQVCVDGEVCRGPTTTQPGLVENGSASFSGPVNPAVSKPKPSRCAKGKVRRGGRCVKPKQAQKKKKGHRKSSQRHRQAQARGTK